MSAGATPVPRHHPRFKTNNFDLLRFAFAFAVFLYHAHVLSGREELAWLGRLFSADTAVKAFFTVSGLLVFMSYESSKDVLSYAEKRIRRIYPAYFTVVVVCALFLAAISTLPPLRYFTSSDLMKYLAANLTFANFVHPDLPGVFQDNRLSAVNGSLWTLKIEVMFYAVVPVIAWLFTRLGRLPVMIAILVGSLAYGAWMESLARSTGSAMYTVLAHQLPGQLCYFIAGAFFYYYFAVLEKRVAYFFVAAVLLLAADRMMGASFLEPLWLATLVAIFGFFFYAGNFGRYGDISYGIYILHFPILQALVHFGLFERSPIGALALATILLLVCAFALWHLVEKRWLRRTSHYVVASSSDPVAAVVKQA
jgi:peptidoglycan/LPS O-acetylase OafA/YrhL